MLPKISTAVAVFGLLGFQAQAQLNVQSGATFFMQPGAQVTVQGDVQNAGTLNNDGSLRVQGNYTNTGTYTGATTGTLEMFGTGNANLTPGTATYPNLVINKATAGDIVTLTANTTVSNGFTLTQGILTTNPTVTPAVALVAGATTPFTFAAGKEVIGSVRRTSWTAGAARVFNQPNMLVTTNGGTAPSDLTVTMIPNGDPTQAEREVKRKFNFATTGGTGFTADVRFPYADAELNASNTEAGLVPWRLVAAEWNAKATAVTKNGTTNWVNTTGIPAADLAQEWKLADANYTVNATAYLRGAWINGTGLLRNVLNTSGLLPLSQPYTGSPYTYLGTESVGSIPNANVVDWVLIELRKPVSGLPEDANSSSIIGRKAAFLLTNGTITELDGVTPVLVPITKQGAANYIVVRHRNHLAVMSTAKASNAVGTFANDFSVQSNIYANPSANSAPATLLGATGIGSTKYGLWVGDSNVSGDLTGADVTQINVAVFQGQTGIYSTRDSNMDGNATGADASLANTSLAATAQTSTLKPAPATATSVQTVKVTHVP
ncbi:MAG: hypothetical protein EOO06_16705 [Chitinophagaceae bacterium]|nr:MAG: hypothetical protein EOO06_16705 [Chitinophagaceae bacterium]